MHIVLLVIYYASHCALRRLCSDSVCLNVWAPLCLHQPQATSEMGPLRFLLQHGASVASPAQIPRHVIILVRKCTCLWHRRRWHKHVVTLVCFLITGSRGAPQFAQLAQQVAGCDCRGTRHAGHALHAPHGAPAGIVIPRPLPRPI